MLFYHSIRKGAVAEFVIKTIFLFECQMSLDYELVKLF